MFGTCIKQLQTVYTVHSVDHTIVKIYFLLIKLSSNMNFELCSIGGQIVIIQQWAILHFVRLTNKGQLVSNSLVIIFRHFQMLLLLAKELLLTRVSFCTITQFVFKKKIFFLLIYHYCVLPNSDRLCLYLNRYTMCIGIIYADQCQTLYRLCNSPTRQWLICISVQQAKKCLLNNLLLQFANKNLPTSNTVLGVAQYQN